MRRRYLLSEWPMYFWNKILHVLDSSSIHHQKFFAVHTAVVYVLTVCEQDQDGTDSVMILLASCQQTCMTYTVAVCIRVVKNSWWWTEELSETCRVYSKNKFVKLVHLVGFIIRIYHDARSPERKIWYLYRRLGGSRGQYRRVRKISPPPRFNSQTVQHVARRYTAQATPAH